MTNEQIDLNDEMYENNSEDELSLSDLGGKFLRNPPVGESITFTVQSFKQRFDDLKVKNPKTGKMMNLALSGTDKNGAKPYCITCTTMAGEEYTISSWGVWLPMQTIWRKFAAEAGNPKLSPRGIVMRVNHILNGKLDENQDKECYVVSTRRADGKFYTIDKETKAWMEVTE